MKLSVAEVDQLRSAFAIARTAGIDAVVITEGLVRGMSPTAKMALISPVNLELDQSIKIGIGRINELDKRLAIFGADTPTAELKLNDKNEVQVLELITTSRKTKVQFRCTSEKMIKYPKANEDEPVLTITAAQAEVAQIARAVKTLGAELVTLAVGRDKSVRFECSSPTNEAFATVLDAPAAFESDPQAVVHTYEGDRLATVLDAAAREAKEISLIVGEFGSVTLTIKGHVLVAMPEANQEDDDE